MATLPTEASIDLVDRPPRNASASKEASGDQNGVQQHSFGDDPNVQMIDRFRFVYDKDNFELQRLGKKPVLKRNFGFMSMFGFNCTVMETWEIMLCEFGGNFTNGGFAGAVYGFIFCWIGTLCVFIPMAELASMAPTSGGQYHWVSMLAPKRHQKLASYIVGWFNVLGWQAIAAIGGYLASNLIQGLVVLTHPDFDPQNWQLTLIIWAVVFFSVFVNTVLSQQLPKIEGLLLIFHVCAFFGILIPLVYMAPHTDPTVVFTQFSNDGGWPTTGLSFFIGLLVPANVLLGADAAIHEIRGASKVVPKVITASLLMNGSLAFLTLLSILFCIGDQDYVFGFPSLSFVAVFFQGTGSRAATTAIVSIITFLIIFSTVSFIATASRMTWAFARDRGLPGWKYLSKVDKRTSIPLTSVAVTMTITCLLALINIGSDVAFNDVLSLVIGGLYTSYLIGNGLLLWHRLNGTIAPYDTDGFDEFIARTSGNTTDPRRGGSRASFSGGPTNVVEAERLTWGPWKVPEPWGTIINAFGMVYLTIVLFFSYWPTTVDPGASGMNWSVLVVGVVAIISIVYYWVWAHKFYVGPVIEVDFGESTGGGSTYRNR